MADCQKCLRVDRAGDGTEHPRLFQRQHRRHRHRQRACGLEIVAQPRHDIGPLDRLPGRSLRRAILGRKQPGRIVQMVPAVAAVVAHPPLIDVGIFARFEAVDRILIVFGENRAARGTAAAHIRLALQKPDPLLVEEVLVAQGPHRTEIDDVAGEFVVEREAGEDIDLLLRAPIDHHQFARPRHLPGKPHAAGAHDAAINEERDGRAHIAAAAVESVDIGPALGLPMFEVVVLQQAFPRFVADRAVDRMVDQEGLLDPCPALLDQRAFGDDHGAILGGRLAARNQLGHHRHFAGGRVARAGFNEAHATTGHHGKPGMPAIVRNLHASPARHLNAVEALGGSDLNIFSVNSDDCHGLDPHTG